MPSETAAARSWARINLSALKAVICFSCLIILGSSCAKKTEEAILGCWAYPPRQIADADGTLFEYMTFSKDGQVRHYALAEYKNGRCVSDYDLRRRYSFDANGNLLVEMADGRTHRYKVLVHFTGRKLTLTEIPGGTSYTLEKDIKVYSCG